MEEFVTRIEHTLRRYPYLVAEEDGRILGYAYVSVFHGRKAYDWSVETSIYVDRNARGKGIGSSLYQALELALSMQGIINLNACIAVPAGEDPYVSRDSQHFHEKCGYHEVGEFHSCGSKFGHWYNVLWMEKLMGDHPANPQPIRLFPEIREELEKKL